jgi:hypothetical protein
LFGGVGTLQQAWPKISENEAAAFAAEHVTALPPRIFAIVSIRERAHYQFFPPDLFACAFRVYFTTSTANAPR